MIGLAVLAGLVAGLASWFATGWFAGMVLESKFGSASGGSAMGGFFVFGPIGGIAGLLLAMGLVLRFGGGSARWGNGLMLGSACVFTLGSLLLAYQVAPTSPQYKEVLEFELELSQADCEPGPTPSTPRWMYASSGEPAAINWPLWGRESANGRCVVFCSVVVDGYRPDPKIFIEGKHKRRVFPIALPVRLEKSLDWSEWQTVEDMRLRYKVDVKR